MMWIYSSFGLKEIRKMKRKENEWLKITCLDRFERGNGKETDGIKEIAKNWEGNEKILIKYLPSSKFNHNLLTIY